MGLVAQEKHKKDLKRHGVLCFNMSFLRFVKGINKMTRECEVTGKKPVAGNNVSHANNRTRRRFLPNLQNRKFWVESENRWVSMKISSAALRTIDKNGIDAVIAKMRSEGKKI